MSKPDKFETYKVNGIWRVRNMTFGGYVAHIKSSTRSGARRQLIQGLSK